MYLPGLWGLEDKEEWDKGTGLGTDLLMWPNDDISLNCLKMKTQYIKDIYLHVITFIKHWLIKFNSLF